MRYDDGPPVEIAFVLFRGVKHVLDQDYKPTTDDLWVCVACDGRWVTKPRVSLYQCKKAAWKWLRVEDGDYEVKRGEKFGDDFFRMTFLKEVYDRRKAVQGLL